MSKAPTGIAVIPLLARSMVSPTALVQEPVRKSCAPAHAPATLNRCRGHSQCSTSAGHLAHDHTVGVAGPEATLRSVKYRCPRIATDFSPCLSLNNRQGKSGHSNDDERQMKTWHPVEICASARVSSCQFRRCIEHVTGGGHLGWTASVKRLPAKDTCISRSSGSE